MFLDSSGNWACLSWDPTWGSCSNANECLTWDDTMFYNSTTKLCEMCPYSYYFDSTARVCRDWNQSCYDRCAYQTMWFQWSQNQYFDLDTTSCVSSWDSSKISVNNSQYHSIPIWKSLNIYVDSTSSSAMELGTIVNPYKNLMLAFIEVLNLHSHSNRTITIYVKENTSSHINIGLTYFINMKRVNLLTYTPSGTSPRQSVIAFTDISELLFNQKTLFNIMANSDMNLSSVLNSNLLTANEK